MLVFFPGGTLKRILSSNLVRLQPSESTPDKFGPIGIVEIVVVPDRTYSPIDVIYGLIVVGCSDLSHLQVHEVVYVCVLGRFVDGWNVSVLFLEPDPFVSRLDSFRLVGVLLVLFSDLCYFSINLRVHVILLVLDRVKRFVIRANPVPCFITLVIAINLASLAVLVSQLQVYVDWRQSFHTETWVCSVFLQIPVRWNVS